MEVVNCKIKLANNKFIIYHWNQIWQPRFVLLVMLKISYIPKKLGECFIQKSGSSKYCNLYYSQFRHEYISASFTKFSEHREQIRTHIKLDNIFSWKLHVFEIIIYFLSQFNLFTETKYKKYAQIFHQKQRYIQLRFFAI